MKKNKNRLKKYLSVILLLIISVLLALAYGSVSKDIIDEDKYYIDLYLKDVEVVNGENLTYERQIEIIEKVQSNVLSISPKGEIGIPLGRPRRPKDLFLMGEGLCYDRSFTLELIFQKLGFLTRHVGLFKDDPELNKLKDLTKKSISSHSITEVKTKKGWLIVDSNKYWLGLDVNGDPFSMKKLEKNNFKVSWKKISTTLFYNEKCHYLYGVYSRHGYFHKPYNKIPDYNIRELLYNFN